MAEVPFDAEIIMNAITDQLRADVDALAIDFMERVVPHTPKDTGHATRNWQVSVGAPTEAELPGVDLSNTFTINNAISKLRASAGRNAFLPVFIQSNIPYIIPLNRGHSPQAEPGFIDKDLDAAIASRSAARRQL